MPSSYAGSPWHRARHSTPRRADLEQSGPKGVALFATAKGGTCRASAIPRWPEILCSKSWVAYAWSTAIAAIAIALAILALGELESVSLTFLGVVAILGAYSMRVLSLQRVLMLDDEGVWHCRGSLGAKPRIVGVRWPYVHCSLPRPRIPWPRTSFTVVIRNRMTGRDITIRHMTHGDRAIARIDSMRQMRRHGAR